MHAVALGTVTSVLLSPTDCCHLGKERAKILAPVARVPSGIVPSRLTALSDKAAIQNNEVAKSEPGESRVRVLFRPIQRKARLMPAKKNSRKRKYSKSAAKDVASAMRRKKRGTLRSGQGGKGGTVKSRKQAIAIGLSEARAKGKKVPQKAA
jgi:hypothetical protein